MSIKNVIAENLRTIRIQKGWTQEFVANQLQISQRTISRAECGCGISKHTLKMLCGLYQVSLTTIYEKSIQEIPKGVQVVPDEVATALLIRTSFVQSFENEVILRYTDTIQKEALMMRSDVERIIPEVLTTKKSYSFAEVIMACLLTNQKTLAKIKQLVME